MRAVNLLPSDYKPVRQASFGSGLAKHPIAIGCTAAAIVVAGLLGMSYQSASKAATSSQRQLDALNARIAAVSQPVNSTNQTVRDRIEQVTTDDATRMSWDGFLTNLARVLPEDVWLTSMNAQESAPATTPAPAAGTAAPAPTPASVPTGFTISGYTYSQASVARLMRRLSLLPWLSGVTLQSSSVTTVGAHSVFQFTIVGAVSALPAKEAS
jgi:Tfp pilus assembly protein PilN